MEVFMGKYNIALNDLIGQGFSKEEAIIILDKQTLNKILLDEDEEYVSQEEIIEESDEDEELDAIDDSIQDFEYDEDEEEELSFEENYTFTDEIDEEY
jgi:hypothetical protein